LRKKRFDFVKAAASGYLDRHPDDEKTALTLLAAIHGQGVEPPRAKDTDALETALALCDSFLSRGLAAPAPFRYAKGLCLLGLGGLSAAIDAFAECLEADPEYRPARAMLLRLKRTLTSA
ncbi:MAG: hypothetical protein LBH24_01230, partial [Clostridiales bacterium]|nr:hypothetical protein [Clostridiales bacterium]